MTAPSRRPANMRAPALPPSPPVPEPEAPTAKEEHAGRDPTRYGDWEIKGIAVDF